MVKDSAITDRPWRGQCATTGWTVDDFRDALAHVISEQPTMPESVTRAAVSIARSYGIKGLADVGYMANVIAGELCRDGVITCPGNQHDRHGRS